MMVDLKLKHLDAHLLFCDLGFIIFTQAGGETAGKTVKAEDQLPQLLIGTAGSNVHLTAL